MTGSMDGLDISLPICGGLAIDAVAPNEPLGSQPRVSHDAAEPAKSAGSTAPKNLITFRSLMRFANIALYC